MNSKAGKMVGENKNDSNINIVWLMVVFSPILTILFSFIFSSWSWGLMDDLAILNSGNNFLERLATYSMGLCSWGVFRPTFVLHSAFAYTIFENIPKGFYIFKMFEVCLLLFVWGLVSYRITKKKISLLLLPAITLSFHYFYDVFFFLSTHEFLGLIFLGICLLFLLKDIDGELASSKRNIVTFFLGILFLLCSFGAKETFVSCGMAAGISYLFLSIKSREKVCLVNFLIKGISLIAITVLYALALKLFIKSSYTSDYSFTNFVKIKMNLMVWFKKDFLNHLPWLLGAGMLFIFASRKEGSIKKSFSNFSLIEKYGILLGIVLYVGFLLMLLPWNTVSYYAAPLGLFFAFIVTLLISDICSSLNIKLQYLIIVMALFLNQFVCQYALNRESSYQNDTVNLMLSIKSNPVFEKSVNDHRIFTNAMEPGTAIPGLMNRQWGLNFHQFRYSSNTNDLLKEDMRYYLYSPRFPKTDLSVFNSWEIMFFSKNWIMYRNPNISPREKNT